MRKLSHFTHFLYSDSHHRTAASRQKVIEQQTAIRKHDCENRNKIDKIQKQSNLMQRARFDFTFFVFVNID